MVRIPLSRLVLYLCPHASILHRQITLQIHFNLTSPLLRPRKRLRHSPTWEWTSNMTPKESNNRSMVGPVIPLDFNFLEQHQWEGLSHILWKIKNVLNHQPVISTIWIHLAYPIISISSMSFTCPRLKEDRVKIKDEVLACSQESIASRLHARNSNSSDMSSRHTQYGVNIVNTDYTI